MLILNTALGIENLSNKSLSLILNHLKIEKLDTLKNLLINNNIFTLLTSCQKDIKYIGEKKLKSFLCFLEKNKLEVMNCIDAIQNKDLQ